jgi:hypothetical protein
MAISILSNFPLFNKKSDIPQSVSICCPFKSVDFSIKHTKLILDGGYIKQGKDYAKVL